MTQVLLFAAYYHTEGFTLEVYQNNNGNFEIVTAYYPSGYDKATTDFDDVTETIYECLTEADNGECEIQYFSTVFERYFEEV